MKTVNKIILVIDTILGITLLAFFLTERFPEYIKFLVVIPISVALGIGTSCMFEGNKKRSFVLLLLVGAFMTFAVMVIIARNFAIDELIYCGIFCVMVSLIISAIAYNISNFAKKRREKNC